MSYEGRLEGSGLNREERYEREENRLRGGELNRNADGRGGRPKVSPSRPVFALFAVFAFQKRMS